jgi:hypothetical protein
MPLDLSTPPRLSNFSPPTRASSASVGGCTMCRANITCFLRRALPYRFPVSRYLLLTLFSVSTLRSAIELKSVFDQIQQAEQSGTLSAEEKKRLEEQAAEKGLQALFKVRLSITSHCCCSIQNDHLRCETKYRARNWRLTPCSERRVTES